MFYICLIAKPFEVMRAHIYNIVTFNGLIAGMLILDKIADLQSHLSRLRKEGSSIGFVATMGALHKGHGSLIDRSNTDNDVTVCSIFVNPSQFNDKSDLDKYPRTLSEDKILLEAVGCDILFVPDVDEIYPPTPVAGSKYLKVNLGNLDKVMEGVHRPGHFAGVIQVVSRLFDIVGPDRAYFGQKDFQQQAIVREMCRQLHYKVEIITCPIVREADGLAMSSRNVRLNITERRVVPAIFETLCKVKTLADQLPLDQIQLLVETEIAKTGLLQLEYFQIVDTQTLQQVMSLDLAESVVACIAVKVGLLRLIDNVILE
jgi:pantoate--beta-alanine ligase